MKVFTVTALSLLVPSAMGFSMLAPRFSDFPRRFGKYLKELDDIFEPDWPSGFIEKQLEDFKDSSSMMFHRASPRYEVTEKSDQFQVTIDVPGFNPEDIEVGLKAGGRILTISGSHEHKDEGRSFSSQFQQNFSIDPSIQIDTMTADMKGHTLTVSAKRVDSLPESRKIPIQKIEGSPENEVKTQARAETNLEAKETMKP